MRKTLHVLAAVACLFLLASMGPRALEPDAQGCKDSPLFNRMPGYRIERCDQKDFDSHSFLDAKGEEFKEEGRVSEIHYSIQEGAKEASRLQILRNYENAVTKAGGTILKSDSDGSSFMKMVKEGKEIWVHVDAYITPEYTVYIVQKQAMAQDIVANAQAFANDIRATGHAAVYGIYFDTGKSEIKPESAAALAEIAKLLKADPGLKVNVVGHTDDVAGIDYNMKLSQARADTVVQALTGKYGIASERLKAYGVGPLAPVASNDSEEGRSKNRRVELVKR
jgi:OOP family OmpA-OmpF porin